MTAVCTNCQKPLNADGSCPACLIRLAFQPTEDSRYPAAGAISPLPPSAYGDLPSINELNERLPQFEVQRLIGRGGMGGIYQARQLTLDRDVAIKLISPQVSKDPAFIERFDREAKALAKLSHPGIVGIFDYGQTTDGLAYLVMEFVDGINLRQAMQLQRIGPNEAIELTIQICHALEYAHSKGVVHRDIKPENILLAEDGTLKVADFGIAKLTDPDARTPTLTATRQVLGSLHYLAPEHIETPSTVDHRVDLYAVGVVLYELLTGHLPIGRYEPPSSVVPTLGRSIDDVVQQALSRRPDERYATAEALRSALVEVQSRKSMPQVRVTPELVPTMRVAIPFSCETMSGFAESIGMIYVEPGSLLAEFRTRDKLFGSFFASKTKSVRIPRERLIKLRLSPGVFHSELTIIADSISTLGDLPNAESGQVAVRIKNSDLAEARAGLRLLDGDERSSSSVFHVSDADSPFTANQQIAYGVFSALCGLLNLGCLAISIVSVTGKLNGGELAIVIIALCFIFASIAITQIVVGCIHWAGFSRGLANVNNVVSLIPLTPVVVVSGPLALWAWARMNTKNGTSPLDSSTPPIAPPVARGATTMMLLRESRTARYVAWLNLIASIGIVVGLAVFLLGLYPVELRFRLLSLNQNPPTADNSADSVATAEVTAIVQPATSSSSGSYSDQKKPSVIRRRLMGLTATVVSDTDDELKIRCWKRSAQAISNALAISGSVQVAWLAETESTEPQQKLPTMLKPAKKSASETAKGLVPTMNVHSLQELQSSWISEWKPQQVSRTRQVVVRLSSTGREWLMQHAGSTAKGSDTADKNNSTLLLIADGLIFGQAELSDVKPDRLVFEIAGDYEVPLEAVYAALRGPVLDFEVEALP